MPVGKMRLLEASATVALSRFRVLALLHRHAKLDVQLLPALALQGPNCVVSSPRPRVPALRQLDDGHDMPLLHALELWHPCGGHDVRPLHAVKLPGLVNGVALPQPRVLTGPRLGAFGVELLR